MTEKQTEILSVETKATMMEMPMALQMAWQRGILMETLMLDY